jgi:hypothetical protein
MGGDICNAIDFIVVSIKLFKGNIFGMSNINGIKNGLNLLIG